MASSISARGSMVGYEANVADGHQPGTALEAWKAGHSPRVEATET